jgi:hypothetical protein
MEKRRQPRKRAPETQPELSVQCGSERFSAKIVDYSEGGFGLEIRRSLEVGAQIRLKGSLTQGNTLRAIEFDGVVRWLVPRPNGRYLCGVANGKSSAIAFNSADPDYYEVLQLSHNADPDTIHRIFRVLAQRFHPDNQETGDTEHFRVLARAYEILSDPLKRASYDAKRPQLQQRWKIFDSASAATGIEAERRKRHGILHLLYMRRVNEPRDPAMSLHDFEQMLGCPREHLEFTLWFLKENAWLARSDNGRFTITAQGVDKAELLGEYTLAGNRMIAAPA